MSPNHLRWDHVNETSVLVLTEFVSVFAVGLVLLGSTQVRPAGVSSLMGGSMVGKIIVDGRNDEEKMWCYQGWHMKSQIEVSRSRP